MGHGGRLLGLADPKCSLPTVADDYYFQETPARVFHERITPLRNDLECLPNAPHVYG